MKAQFIGLSSLVVSLLWGRQHTAEAFAPRARLASPLQQGICMSATSEASESSPCNGRIEYSGRRAALATLSSGIATCLLLPSVSRAEESMFSPKFVQEYPDFIQTKEGWSYKDVKVGSGESPKVGDRVVYEWSGYTIGYFGRPFEAKGGPKGGAFDKDLDYSRAVLGSGTIVKGLESAFTSMKPGGIRQVIIPYGELGYPASDGDHESVGPKPTTFSGMRALNFVLDNPRVDRTMLFNIKLVRIDKPDGKGGFLRGDKA